ncbi:cell division protein ZapE [Gilvimarinus sp. F26214L]|uniref:cell division protein ZapE n=1 Tax=Gilvimarinus sp. DZF01 TaxID=3461371 RepID=UPI004045C74A
MTPKERYQSDLLQPGFLPDPAQEQVVDHLQDLYERLVRRPEPKRGLRFLPFLSARPIEPERGLYLWGGVGRGKTYLMDVFFESLPFENKMRAHFHRFMRRIHQELKSLAGHSDPLEQVADRLSREARIICFDEFFVSDITDAMILGNLLQALFRRGVCLVATSNITPDLLYKDGLQRERFLPAIALIQRHTRVVHVDSPTDYRLRALEKAELYHCPLDTRADESLSNSFANLTPEQVTVQHSATLEVEGRPIKARCVADDVAWFDFPAICDGPRSQNDYIELAREFHTVLISNVPIFTAAIDDQARRFINLVDEFYDRNVKLVLSAAGPLESLYTGTRLRFEFERTASRLLEMQSHDYLARAHRP